MTRPSLGPYTLLRRIGVGGMGEVWIARREAIGGAAKLVALKTVLPEKASNAESRSMFLDEARLAMLMTNSNIVQVFDVDETEDNICYMAMEYVEGLDLAKLTEALSLRGEQLSVPAIAHIIGEVFKALAYAHDHNIEGVQRTVVHRDISPQNVMISISGEVKVTDFGIARLASEETSGSFVRGKFRYMPPEQFQRGVRAPTLDLFAVGALLHELLDGKRFRGGDLEETELIGMCVRGLVPQLSCPPGRVPRALDQLRLRLLEPDARKRIQTAREAHRMLSQWPGNRDCKFELEDIVKSVAGDTTLPTHLLTATASGQRSKSVQKPSTSAAAAPKLPRRPAPAPPPAAAGAVSRAAAPAAASRYAGAAARSRPGAPPSSASPTGAAPASKSSARPRPSAATASAPQPSKPAASKPSAATASAPRPSKPAASKPRPGASPSLAKSPTGSRPASSSLSSSVSRPRASTSSVPRPSAPAAVAPAAAAPATAATAPRPVAPPAEPLPPPVSTPTPPATPPAASRPKQTMFFGSRVDVATPGASEPSALQPPVAEPPPASPAPQHTQQVDLDSVEFLEIVAEHRAEASLRS
ncbi:MAG: protein kinase, partial [Myxococcales bacterium]|nr:protein kinase [Myxococcales bacterium]